MGVGVVRKVLEVSVVSEQTYWAEEEGFEVPCSKSGTVSVLRTELSSERDTFQMCVNAALSKCC